ncbi:BLUF domain-containing protein [uncultured Paracoccus sp.]|uniref:BLUF domain-containing protein n=1 Tax=uncultured Paracoccus sp. TaxID=189685 RepID=UPI00261417BF|nr:BLUF domain-containing protein [uncultured Paracoccus sp.]
MTSDTGPEDGLTHFLYRSNARPGFTTEDLRTIVAEARSRNSSCGVTGCLHYEDGLFFQWLEGPKIALDMIIALIRKDPRHEDMTDLSYGPLTVRRFADWSMRATDRHRASLLDWFASNQVSTIDRIAYAGSVSAFLVAISV